MLEMASRERYDDAISWIIDGYAFRVHDVNKFVSHVLPNYFGSKPRKSSPSSAAVVDKRKNRKKSGSSSSSSSSIQYRSFQRQLNSYGFERIVFGRHRGGYHNPFLIRGQEQLCHWIERTTTTKSSSSSTATAPSSPSSPPVAAAHQEEQEGQEQAISKLPRSQPYLGVATRVQSQPEPNVLPPMTAGQGQPSNTDSRFNPFIAPLANHGHTGAATSSAATSMIDTYTNTNRTVEMSSFITNDDDSDRFMGNTASRNSAPQGSLLGTFGQLQSSSSFGRGEGLVVGGDDAEEQRLAVVDCKVRFSASSLERRSAGMDAAFRQLWEPVHIDDILRPPSLTNTRVRSLEEQSRAVLSSTWDPKIVQDVIETFRPIRRR